MTFEKLFAVERPIYYTQSAVKMMTLMAVGDMGAGKSTTLNYIKVVEKRKTDPTYEYDPDDSFKAQVSISAVTTETEMKTVGDMLIIDTIGTCDPKRDDLGSYLDATNFLKVN